MAAKKPPQASGSHVNPVIKFSEVELEGQTYRLAFDYRAIARVERETGVNMLKALSLSELNANDFLSVFYAALLPAQPELRLVDVYSLFQIRNMKAITEAITEAWFGSVENPTQPE